MASGIDRGLSKAKKMIEAVIASLGIKPEKNTVESIKGGFAWKIHRGSACVMISLIPGNDKTAGRLRVVAPIVRIEGELSMEMATRLLELNATELPGISFGLISKNVIVLVDERSILELDKLEVVEMLNLVGYYGDKYDDLLVSTYGGKRVCDLG